MLVAVFVGWSLAEALLRDGLAWRPLVLAISVVVALTLPWRRTHPLRAVVVAFGTLLAFDVLRIVAVDGTGLASIAAVLLLPYALFRWGAGREAVLGLTLILSWLAVTHIADPTPPGEVVAAVAFFLLSAALGAAMRFQAHARTRAIEQATLRERSELARELHDASVTMCRRSPSRPGRPRAGRLSARTGAGRAHHHRGSRRAGPCGDARDGRRAARRRRTGARAARGGG